MNVLVLLTILDMNVLDLYRHGEIIAYVLGFYRHIKINRFKLSKIIFFKELEELNKCNTVNTDDYKTIIKPFTKTIS